MTAIPEEFLRSSAFLCAKEIDKGVEFILPRATAFMVAVPLEGADGLRVAYIVTARHCIYEARAEGHKTVYIRLNRKSDGEAEDIPVATDEWHTSDHDDVAVVPWVHSRFDGKSIQDYTITAFSVEQFVSGGPEYRFEGHVPNVMHPVSIQPREGSEIYCVGLFSAQAGKKGNLPVARFGHISRSPSLVTFDFKEHGAFESTAYLAEFLSWGGYSGSPVYFLEPFSMMVLLVDNQGQQTGGAVPQTGQLSGFLGMISHHYDIQRKAEVSGDWGDVETLLNSGIAVVVPAEAIRLLVMREDLVEERAMVRSDVEARPPVQMSDSAIATDEVTRNIARVDPMGISASIRDA